MTFGPCQSSDIISYKLCHKALSCAFNDSIQSDTIYGRGYKSVYNSSIYTLNTLSCTGGFSCAEAKAISARIDIINCEGSNSCSKTLNIDAKEIRAYGASALSYSNININNGSFIECSGEEACAYSTIYVNSNKYTSVYGYGAYSLLYTVIDTRNTAAILDIHLLGHYSGFGANITCRAAANCTIDCHQNCVVNTPITNILYNYDINDIMKHDIHNVIATNEAACLLQSDNMTFDDFQEARYIVINVTEGPICCRADESCAFAALQLTSGSVICNGQNSCHADNITNDGSLLCVGESSCSESNIIHTNGIIYCAAVYACSAADIITTADVYCSGHFSCASSVITSNGINSTIHFYGSSSGTRSNISCSSMAHCTIVCKGERSCDGVNVVCNGRCDIICDNDSFCPNVINVSSSQSPSITNASVIPLYPSYQATHNAIVLDETLTVINITLNVNIINASLNKVIQTVNDTITIYLIANEIATSLVTDVISSVSGNTVIIAFVFSDELESAQINTTEIEQSLNDNFPDDNVVVKRVDVVHVYKQKDKTENKNDPINTYVFILLLSSSAIIFIVLLVIVYKCYTKTQKHHQVAKQKENMEQNGDHLAINNMDALHETQDITPMGLHKRANKDALEVQYWLQHIVELPQYFKTFMDSGYEAMSFIRYIPNMVELSEIGVESKVHQMRLWEEIKKLKGEDTEQRVAENKKREGSINDTQIILPQKHQNETEETHETTEMSEQQTIYH